MTDTRGSDGAPDGLAALQRERQLAKLERLAGPVVVGIVPHAGHQRGVDEWRGREVAGELGNRVGADRPQLLELDTDILHRHPNLARQSGCVTRPVPDHLEKFGERDRRRRDLGRETMSSSMVQSGP